jgi:hypothetical protein
MKDLSLFLAVFFLGGNLLLSSCSQPGCTDPAALNFSTAADANDGSCVYPNVASDMVSVFPSEWQGDGLLMSAIKPVPIINPRVASNGAVLCYLVEPDGLQIQLPVSISQPDYTTNYWFNFFPGDIEFVIQDDDGLTPPPADIITFRIVTIDQLTLKSAPDVDFTDYQEVARTFGIRD